jgi:EAL domain-containing protein (putative c-di-GMP-specific phosphodiesterase class I)
LEVVAEGVETIRQLTVLKGLAEHPDFLVQGFYFAKPMSVADFETRYRPGAV